MLLVLPESKIRTLAFSVGVALALLLAACGSTADDPTAIQTSAVTPTAVATTPPLAIPTEVPTPEPTPAPTITSVPVATVVPTPDVEPTAAEVAESPAPTAAPQPTTAPAATEVPVSTPEPTIAAEPTPEPTAATDPTAAPPTPEPTATAAEAPTAVVVSGAAPIECYDPEIGTYRGYVEGVDSLTFGSPVECIGAGTNGVSAARSYRHSSGLVVQRFGDFILNDAGTGYTPYSGLMHFCLGTEASTAPLVSDNVPTLLVVIDNEARAQVARGATGPTSFTSAGAQC